MSQSFWVNGLRKPKSRICQVLGCGTSLKSLRKTYCTRLGVCPSCMKASSVRLPGDDSQPMRFCFQCGKVQPLTMFEGNKRSCKTSLQKRHVAQEADGAGPALHNSSKRRAFRLSSSTDEAEVPQLLAAGPAGPTAAAAAAAAAAARVRLLAFGMAGE
ncbi:hypothetical protein OEZ85_013646 [Tetradesmus obliquus]|uniref:SBP-type domain-containing protein n=1 Tax=Tetradesmus obliquus TaxID=3088 RepID=A0ABY8UQY9_TETOB|nr:hypothetical protein OEZ85_013646 [Tetradesmus obliquus]